MSADGAIRQVSHDVVRREYDLKGFSQVLHDFRRASAPKDRFAEHLLIGDLHETYIFALRNPEALRQVVL